MFCNRTRHNCCAEQASSQNKSARQLLTTRMNEPRSLGRSRAAFQRTLDVAQPQQQRAGVGGAADARRRAVRRQPRPEPRAQPQAQACAPGRQARRRRQARKEPGRGPGRRGGGQQVRKRGAPQEQFARRHGRGKVHAAQCGRRQCAGREQLGGQPRQVGQPPYVLLGRLRGA